MTQKPTLYFRILLFIAGLQIFTQAQAQVVEVKISLVEVRGKASISGRFLDNSGEQAPGSLAFKREVAGYPALATRVNDLSLFGRDGNVVEVRKLMDGEYVAGADYSSWKYTVDLAPPKDRAGFAHASWIGDSSGVLMFDDLLPLFVTRPDPFQGSITLKLPAGWELQSAGTSLLGGDPSRSVAFIGKGHRIIDVKPRSGDLKLLLSGGWHFTDEEASGMAREIFDEYSKLLGNLPKQGYMVALLRFPTQDSPGHWEAETRGRTVTIFSSDMPFRTQSLQRLHEQLRHEIFHLWFPNGVKLTGDYAWFYEGFAMYSSLKLAVKLNRIRFEDFLDTLARAHTIDSNSRPRRPLTDSGIDPTVRYARGMLIAFLTDIEILGNSGGKDDVGIRLQGLFKRHQAGKAAALDAVRSVIASNAFQRYVEGTDAIDWTRDVSVAGIESTQNGRRSTTLTVVQKPNGRQKRMLDRLGYNNWRKLGSKK